MAVKETIDIEALLYRAYAQMRVDRVGRAAAARMIGLDAPRGFAAPSYDERVDTSAPGSRLAARASEVAGLPDDILTLHDRVLALAEVWFARHGDDVGVWDKAEAARHGLEIVKVGPDWWLQPHGAADEATRLEQAGVMVLVIQHARDGTRPDVHEGWKASAGRRPADRAAHDHRGRRRKGVAVSQAEVQHDRACYHAWRCALALLAAQCEELLDDYQVTGPLAAETPWLRGSTQAKAAERQNVACDNALVS